ncbi:uncharacterized protein LOC113851076 [Abrus precatorius]|uniref:Uncharacterized protein LOC113851076 n=1 Tax=Abrus precatorius TaxID=3816 RepID=A0A8B8K1S0_ABRPR|nr:uncharacterized protein LOC113851076 [Abrus precatorius]
MANSTPIRPWSRLASLRSVTSASEPYSNPSLKASQARHISSLDNNVGITTSLPSTPPSNQSPTQSQKFKHTTPFIFPPSKLKVNPEIEIQTKIKIPGEEETKAVLINGTVEKPNANDNGSLHKESIETQKQSTGHHEKQVKTKENERKGKGVDLGSDGNGITRVITIAGENRGAYMEILKPQEKPIKKMGNFGNGEEDANEKEKNRKVRTISSLPKSGFYVNSNVQCVNSSMMFHTSCTHNDPGVHLSLSKKPFGERVDGQSN